jgi:hypothetical protein
LRCGFFGGDNRSREIAMLEQDGHSLLIQTIHRVAIAYYSEQSVGGMVIESAESPYFGA